MEFRNHTPFPALAFQMLDRDENEYHVVVMRATLDINNDGTLQFSEEQAPLAVTDEYFGEMNKSSVRQESDLAPFKPKCDVIVNATAYAPGGKPAPSFEVGIRITGNSGTALLEKKLTVTGPRYWKEKGKEWELTEPEPIESLPLRHEYTYGGECRIEKADPAAEKLDSKHLLTPEQRAQHPAGPDNAPAAHTACETNPVGMGFAEPWYLEATRPEAPPLPQQPHNQPPPRRGIMDKMVDRLLGVTLPPVPSGEAPVPAAESRKAPAPQIESPADPVREFGRHYAPQGFGVIGKGWLPRRKLCGTVDEDFISSGKPLPDDFDFAFWNCAHPDMQVPYLTGDETIQLTNLTPEGKLSIQLPCHLPYLLVGYDEGAVLPAKVNLDTLIIEPGERKVTCVYRFLLPLVPEIASLEAGLVFNDKENRERKEAING
jgi:hypothetical protein